MTSAFAWLNDLMTWLGKWFPRLVLVKPGNAGVLFTGGGRAKPKGLGLHVYWPIIQDFQTVSTRLRTLELCAQLHEREVVAIVVTYRILDPVTVLTTLHDARAYLDDRTQAALTEVYEARATNEQLGAGVFEQLQRIFRDSGVLIKATQVAQRGWALPLKNISDWAFQEQDVA